MKNQKGFTLIELLVVIALLGVMASIVISFTSGARMKARDVKRKADLQQLTKALELYYDEYGKYPPARFSRSCGGYRRDWATSYCRDKNWLSTDNNFLKYMPNVPRDPLNRKRADDTPWWQANTYTYGVSRDGQKYDLLTNLENPKDPDRCAIKIWKSQAVWAGEPGCYSSGVAERSKMIYATK